MIRAMREAAEYGDYNAILAGKILLFLDPSAYVVDAGCGLGHLALELSKSVRRVTAIDRNEDALRVLEENRAFYRADNLEIRRCLIEDFTADEAPDAMVFCLFGTPEEMIAAAERSKCRRIIAVYRRENDELWHGRVVRPDLTRLTQNWRVERSFQADIPLNQPFGDFCGAREFTDLYPLDDSGVRLSDEALKDRLHLAAGSKYRFELPVTRRLEICLLLRDSYI